MHVYNNLEMRLIRSHSIFQPWGGVATAGEGYEQNLKPIDDLLRPQPRSRESPGLARGQIVVRGTVSENGKVKKVIVNDRPARSVRGSSTSGKSNSTGFPVATACPQRSRRRHGGQRRKTPSRRPRSVPPRRTHRSEGSRGRPMNPHNTRPRQWAPILALAARLPPPPSFVPVLRCGGDGRPSVIRRPARSWSTERGEAGIKVRFDPAERLRDLDALHPSGVTNAEGYLYSRQL